MATHYFLCSEFPFSFQHQCFCKGAVRLSHRFLSTLKILSRDVFTDGTTRVFTQVLHLLASATICGDKLRLLLALEPLEPFSFSVDILTR